MNKIIALIALAATLPLRPAAAPFDEADSGKESDIVMSKIIALDMMNFLLPLAMTREQYLRALPVLERIRADTKLSEQKEAKALRELEPKLDASLKDCVEKGLVPTREFRAHIAELLKSFSIIRQAQIADNVSKFYTALKDIWTPTQMKIAAQSLEMKDYVPADKVDQMSDEDKAKIFVREVMLNPASYQVMLRLSSPSQATTTTTTDPGK